MYCSSCGTPRGDGRLRCPECFRLGPAFWLNLFGSLLLVMLVLTNVFYLRDIFPVLGNFAVWADFDLPLATRLHVQLYHLLETFAVPLLVLAIVVILVLRRMKIRVLRFFLSGKVLALATWGALLISLVGILAGYEFLLRVMARLIRRG